MFKLLLCVVLATAAFGLPIGEEIKKFEEHLKHDIFGSVKDLIDRERQHLIELGKRESIGHQLKEQLKNTAISSLSTAVGGVLDKAIEGLTSKAVAGITNLLGHIHIGKRSILGEFLHGDLVHAVEGFLHKEKEHLLEILHHHQTRSTGSELREALKNAAIGSVSGAIDTVVNKAVEGLTNVAVKGITNVLGHLHFGKRDADFDIISFEQNFKNDLLKKVHSIIDFEKHNIIDAVLHNHRLARRNIFGDIGKLLGNEIKTIGENALGSLGQLATDKLNGLIGKIGKREAEKRNIFGDIGKLLGSEIKTIGENALGSLGQLATDKLNSLIGKIGKRDLPTESEFANLFNGVAENFSNALTQVLGELPQIFTNELGPLIAQFTGSQ